MRPLHLRKSIGRSLLLLLGFLAFPNLVAAYPQLTIPFTNLLIDGIIFHTDGHGHTLDPPVYVVPPVTLLAWGGNPLSGYTWTLSTGSTFPMGTTVDPLTGIFHSNGGRLVAGTHSFDMTVSDGSTTAHATFSFTVTDDWTDIPNRPVFSQLNRSTFALPDARAGLGYGASLYADGGTPPYHDWQLAWGALPPGMVIDQARGIVRGSPSASGSYSFGIDVLDDTNAHAINYYNLTYTINVSTGGAPSPPAGSPATNIASNSFTANWSSVTGATGYRLDVSTNSSFSSYVTGYQNLDAGSATSRNVTGLSPSTTYYYRVRAYNGVGTSSNSNVVSVTTTPIGPAASQLRNISTRAFVQTGDNVMIGGFIVQGTQPKRVIIRAIGPELSQYGVPSALADPTLELHDSTRALIGYNDDWQTTVIDGIITHDQVQEIMNSGHAPGNGLESAIIATLAPGDYTAVLRGYQSGTGVALVEVYDLDR